MMRPGAEKKTSHRGVFLCRDIYQSRSPKEEPFCREHLSPEFQMRKFWLYFMEDGGTIDKPICVPTFTRSVIIWAKTKNI